MGGHHGPSWDNVARSGICLFDQPTGLSRLASTLLGLLCLKSLPRLPFTLLPAEGAVQHIPLLPNSCLCAGSLNRHQNEKFSRLSVHGGTKDKGMNRIHPLLPGEAPGPLRLCFSIFFPLGHAGKNNLGPGGK